MARPWRTAHSVVLCRICFYLVTIDTAQVVTFEWQARRFAIRTSLEAFEMKGNRLLITGAEANPRHRFAHPGGARPLPR
jgi:hypothetical protein